MRNIRLIYIFLFIISAFVIYFLFIRISIINLYCRSKIEMQINNFRRSVKRNGESVNPEDERLMSTHKRPMFENCLKNEQKSP